MRISDLLIEARRNPNINPKVDNLSRLNYLAKDPTLQVTYSDFPKVGINPMGVGYQSTPLGYYAYPIWYAIKNMNTYGKSWGMVPYAGERDYAIVFKIMGNILYLDTHRPNSLEAEAVLMYVESLSNDRVLLDEVEWMGKNTLFKDGIMKFVLKTSQMLKSRINKKVPNIMRDIFKDVLGWDAVIDRGTGRIHRNEPVQSVVFDRRNIKVVEILDNRYSHVSDKSTRKSASYSSRDLHSRIFDSIERVSLNLKREINFNELPNKGEYELAMIAPIVSKYTREFAKLIQEVREYYEVVTGRENNDPSLSDLTQYEGVTVNTCTHLIALGRKYCYEGLRDTPDAYLVRDMRDWEIYMDAFNRNRYDRI